MWALILPLITSIFSENGPIGQYFKTKAATAQAVLDNKLAVEKAQLDYAKAMAEAAVTQSANQLNATSQSFKIVSYALLTFPIILVVLIPSSGERIFQNLSLIPAWYAQLYVAVVAVIWGLPVASNVVSNIFSGVQSAWNERQGKKIEKIVAFNESKLFDSLRKSIFKKGLTQDQVNAINEALAEAKEG